MLKGISTQTYTTLHYSYFESILATTPDSYLKVKTLVIQDLPLLPRLVQVLKQLVEMINLALNLPHKQHTEQSVANNH